MSAVGGPFEFLGDFASDAVGVAAETGGVVFDVGDREFAEVGEVLGAFVEDDFADDKRGDSCDADDDVDGEVAGAVGFGSAGHFEW